MSMDERKCMSFIVDPRPQFLANDHSEGTFPDGVDSMHEGSPPHSSAIADNDVSSDGPLLDRSVPSWEVVDGKLAIAFFPDFIVFRDLKSNCTDFKVIFFDNYIDACGSTAHEEGGFSIKLAIEDVVDIRSQRCGRHEMVEVKINVITRGAQQVGNVNDTSSVEELSFCVVDSQWHDKIEEIISLNVKYKEFWNFMPGTDVGLDMEALLSQKPLPVPKKFFPNSSDSSSSTIGSLRLLIFELLWDDKENTKAVYYQDHTKFVENFEEVIYPEGDPDAVSISMRDLDMVNPDTFINDTIIDFYIKYLKNTMILPEERPRFHFFNCFFFRKLADMDKNPSSAFEGRAAFLRVRKWTRKLDLFSKDFIFIPVNYSYHWSLIVICHPGEIVKITDENAENLSKVPCILHMDSFRGSHANLKDLIQSYLWQEWRERQRETDEAIASKFLNLRFVLLELPQQPNMFDCGLFLLHYLESFLDAHLENFSPFMMKKSEIPYFLTSKWFLPDEPYRKRSTIMRLVHGLVNKHHFSCSSEQHCPSNNPKSDNDKENPLKLFGVGLSPSKDGSNQPMPISNGALGIEMDLLQSSSFDSPQGVISGSGLVLREFFDPMSSATVLLDVKQQPLIRTSSFSLCRNGLPSIEEEVQFVQSSTESDSQHIVANDPEASANQRFSHEEHENTVSFPPNPACDSGGSLDSEKCPVRVVSLDDHMDHPNPESEGNTESSRKPELTTVGDHMDHQYHESAGNTQTSRKPELTSLDDHLDHPNHESLGNTESSRKRDCPSGVEKGISCSLYPRMIADHPITFLDNLPEPSLQSNGIRVQEGGGIIDDQLVADVLLESQHEPAAKRMRPMFSLEINSPAATLSEDLHL